MSRNTVTVLIFNHHRPLDLSSFIVDLMKVVLLMLILTVGKNKINNISAY
jgi:hypothetical protein